MNKRTRGSSAVTKRHLGLVVGCIAAFASLTTEVASAQVVLFSDLGSGGTYRCCSADAAAGSSYAGGGLMETAASFVPTMNAALDQIDLALGSLPGYSDAVTISVTTDDGGWPGSPLMSWTASGFPQFQNTSSTLQTFIPTTSLLLSANTTYWILEAPAASTTYATWNIPVGAYAPGTITDFYSFGVWRTNNPDAPLGIGFGIPSTAFDVVGSSVPEPSGEWLMGGAVFLAIGIARFRWKRPECR